MATTTDSNGKHSAIDLAITQIERTYGKGAIMRMSEGAQVKVPAISTGSISLDYALGIGGIPRGRVIEIYGPESSGKTTLSLHIIAEAQKAGGQARVQSADGLVEAGAQDDISLSVAADGAIGAEVFSVVGIGGLPPQFPKQLDAGMFD